MKFGLYKQFYMLPSVTKKLPVTGILPMVLPNYQWYGKISKLPTLCTISSYLRKGPSASASHIAIVSTTYPPSVLNWPQYHRTAEFQRYGLFVHYAPRSACDYNSFFYHPFIFSILNFPSLDLIRTLKLIFFNRIDIGLGDPRRFQGRALWPAGTTDTIRSGC